MKFTERKQAIMTKEYEEIHKRELPHMVGGMVMYHVWDIQNLCMKYKPATMLDYGCGKAYGYKTRKIHRLWNVSMSLYDIGIPEHNKLPADDVKIDSIICCDVLEHIPEEEIDSVLEYWYSLNPKFVYATVAQYPAVAKLEDGRNAHVTLKETDWWEEKFFKFLNCPTYVLYYPVAKSYIKHVYKKG